MELFKNYTWTRATLLLGFEFPGWGIFLFFQLISRLGSCPIRQWSFLFVCPAPVGAFQLSWDVGEASATSHQWKSLYYSLSHGYDTILTVEPQDPEVKHLTGKNHALTMWCSELHSFKTVNTGLLSCFKLRTHGALLATVLLCSKSRMGYFSILPTSLSAVKLSSEAVKFSVCLPGPRGSIPTFLGLRWSLSS